MHTLYPVDGYEWDPLKAAADPDAIAEARFVALAADPTGRILVTVFAHVGAKVRIISARRASPGERKRYEKR